MASTELSRFVRERYYRRFGEEPSARSLAEASGGRFKHAAANRLIQGTHGDLEEETIRGLVTALACDISEIRKRLGQASHSLGRFDLPSRADRLTSKERKVVVSVVDAILAARQGARRVESTSDDERHLKAVASGSTKGRATATETAKRVRSGEEPQR